MRNNIQNDVKIEAAENHYTKKNLSGSISNTHSLGRVGVCFSRAMLPDSKAMCAPESLIQTTPLVSPCYAKQHYKQWHMFIPIEDIFKNYSALMTGKEISRDGAIIAPDKFPHIPACNLAEFALNGAKCTMWFKQLNKYGEAYDSAPGYGGMKPTGEFFCARGLSTLIPLDAVQGASASVTIERLVDIAKTRMNWQANADGVPVWNTEHLMSHTVNGGIPTFYSGNLLEKSFILPDLDEDENTTDEIGYDLNSFVSIDGADVVFYDRIFVSFEVSTEMPPVYFLVAYAFRLSSWGAELYKIIRGLGYGFDLDDNSFVSVLPLIAAYKAYWDIFGLNLWQNYESTFAGRLQTYYDNRASVPVAGDADAFNLFYNFIMNELGQMWLTEKNDYISAHLPQPVIGDINQTPLFGVADVQETESDRVGPAVNIYPGDGGASPVGGQPSLLLEDGHAKTRKTTHGALDSEILKRMYKATNIQTALGQKIVALMKANGLGTYMERTRINYIGDFNVNLDVSAVTATSDTYQSASKDGRPLGSRAGKCVGYNKGNKKMFYRTDCFGWWIALDCITADSGWSQGVDLTNKVIKREDMYQPRYDALGLKIDTADVLVGTRDTCFANLPDVEVGTKTPARKSWGYAPRYAEFKVGRSLDNGGFALKSRRNYFLTYDMNKLIFVDNLTTFPVKDKTTDSIKTFRVAKSLSVDDLPIAGNPYRFLNRWPWLANLGRIFAEVGQTLPSFMFSGGALRFLAKAWEYVYLNDDNYIVQSDIWFKAWNTAIPIEETYGTIDPEEHDLKFIERV